MLLIKRNIYIVLIHVFSFFVEANVVDVYDIDHEFIPTQNGHTYWVPNVPVDEKPKRVLFSKRLTKRIIFTRFMLLRVGLVYINQDPNL